MKLASVDSRILKEIIDAGTDDFGALCRIATLDPSRDFKFANLADVDFGYSDLSGFDFTGANLRNADFRRARYDRAILKDADLRGARWPDTAPKTKPIIFISYSHKDEPEYPREGEVQWLSYVRSFLQPAVKHGIFDLWADQQLADGKDWAPKVEQKLRQCDIFILLVSPNSMASDNIIDREIAIIRERQSQGQPVYFYPVVLTPTPKAALDKLKDANVRPRKAKSFSGFTVHDRAQMMSDIADEIAEVAERVTNQKSAVPPSVMRAPSHYVHLSGLPETSYERLVGRETELKRLDEAWGDRKTSIISFVAEGGAGKSALVNEWLGRLQAENYRGAEAVLGWSFYSQGTKERATSAEAFLNWVLAKLGLKIETTSAVGKGEAIAEALMRRRVLLVLDGVEPLQHGLDKQLGQLKDQGLRALLRRFVAAPLAEPHGLVVLTSRLAVKDIARWRDSAAPVVDVERLSDEAGAALLRDNGVWGVDQELKAAAHDFGGHPLALDLLASFLKETQNGDVRRRDRIRAYFADIDNPRHDHARRMMESYEREWLVGQPVLLAIMQMIGLFDRPASGDCLAALRRRPIINGLTDQVFELEESDWQRAVTRLREARLLGPHDPAAPDTLDAHPLVREWFGERLRQTNEMAWKTAQGRLYEHLRDTTKEGHTPSLEDLAPLYQAIGHGCRADRHQDALEDIYINRISRRKSNDEIEFYARRQLGAIGSDLAALSWFFETLYDTPVATLTEADKTWALNVAGFTLRAQGRFVEALPAQRAALRMMVEASNWRDAAMGASNLGEVELLVGQIAAAVVTTQRSVAYADRSGDSLQIIVSRTIYANTVHSVGKQKEAEQLFVDAERRYAKLQSAYPLLYSLHGYRYCDLLLAKGEYATVLGRVAKTIEIARRNNWLLDKALDALTVGRAHLGLALHSLSLKGPDAATHHGVRTAHVQLDEALDGLRASGELAFIPCGLLARATFRRSIGDWHGSILDLDEVEEIAEPGPMRLYLCDMALERARLALAQIEAFAPLSGLIDDSPSKPIAPDTAEVARLKEGAENQLAIAADYIKTCGYHRRDAELAELQAVRHDERKFSDLPPRA